MNKIFNLYKNSEKQATILIYGEIGDSFWGDGINEKEIAKELQDIKDVEEITVKINSPGGNVYSGIAIYNSLKNHAAKINVEIDGLCASIATIIAMAGDTITMNPGTNYMIHDPMTIAMGNAKDLEAKVERLEQVKNSILEIYMTKVKITRDEVIKLMENETHMNGEEALRRGFITNIAAEEGFKNKMSNGYDMGIFINCMLSKEDKKEEEEMMKKEDLKNKYPALYNEIYNEGKITGETSERERIKNLDAVSKGVKNFSGAEEIVNKAKYEEIKDAATVSMEILTNCVPNPVKEEKQIEINPQINNLVGKFDNKKADAQDIGQIENSQPVDSGDIDNKLLEDLKNIS